MNPNDLKKGQSYLILANYDGKDCDNDYVFTAVPAEIECARLNAEHRKEQS